MKVKVKFNKECYDVDLNLEGSAADFKSTIFNISGVPPERQKLMTKGGWSKSGFMGVLKDDFQFSDTKIKDGQLVTLMGSAGSSEIKPPVVPIKFVEDMTEEEKAEKGAVIPAGLINMGNTCYMNSTIQCLRHMPELRDALKSMKDNTTSSNNNNNNNNNNSIGINMSTTLGNTFDELDKAGNSLQPMRLVMDLHRYFPQFATRSNQGNLMQHDAQELLGEILKILKQGLENNSNIKLDDLFTIGLEDKLICKEDNNEATRHNIDSCDRLTCNIQGGPLSDVKIEHLKDGVLLGLQGEVELLSENLGRNAIWEKKSRITKLPLYICVHFLRFFWKQTPDSRDHSGVKCKIRKSVTFPSDLDIYDFCCEPLQTILGANRVTKSKQLDAEMEAKRQKMSSGDDDDNDNNNNNSSSSSNNNNDNNNMETEDDEDEVALQQALALSMGTNNNNDTTTTANTSMFAPQLPNEFTGDYELMGIVTHKGADADSGHYIAWVRQEPGSQYWWKYDDDKVSEVTWEKIVELKGGGEWATAYLTFYRAKI